MDEMMDQVVTNEVKPAMDIVEATARKSGKSAAAVMGVAAGVFVVGGIIVGGVKLGAKFIKEHQEKKALRKPENVVEPTQEQLDEVTE